MRHLLEASFKIDKETENIKVMFVDCGENPISVDYENDLLNINSKWRDYNVIHEDYPCRISSSKDNEPGDYFYCDHIVEQLYEQSLQQLCKVMSTSPIQKRWRKMSRTLREKLEEMPRRVIAQKTSSPNGGTVAVSWELELSGRVLSRLGEEIEYCVILHDHGCALESSEIIFRDIKYERQWEAWEAVEFPTLFRSFSFEEHNPVGYSSNNPSYPLTIV